MGISMYAIAAITRAVEWRTRLLRKVSHRTASNRTEVDVLGFGEDDFGELCLDLFPLISVKLEPEVSAILRDTFPELDGRELADLYGIMLVSRSSREGWLHKSASSRSLKLHSTLIVFDEIRDRLSRLIQSCNPPSASSAAASTLRIQRALWARKCRAYKRG